jgi:DNA-binding transcriptional MerR regulator
VVTPLLENTISKNNKKKQGTGIIPEKNYFKIGEVGQIVGVDPYVLRYWESEFKIIRPQRASSKQRLYRKIDVENFIKIKQLLYEKRFTISGAKKEIRNKPKKTIPAQPTPNGHMENCFLLSSKLKDELLKLKKFLEK